MNAPRRITNRLGKPVMLFDGDCRFCRLWIERWRQATGDAVDYRELQEPTNAENFPELTRAELEEAVHLIAADGTVSRGAEAVFESLAFNPSKQWPLRLYRHSPFFAGATESAYGIVARNRMVFSWFTRALWGKHVERSPDLLTRWIFLRGLGLIYLIAFVSLWVQVNGLIGSRGILPVDELMSSLHVSGVGFYLAPTLSWFSTSDAFLHFQCALGTSLAAFLIVGVAPRICLAGLWLLYLSLSTVGQEFLQFQWDSLLLETGLLAIFLAPSQFLPRPTREKPFSRAAIWLLRLLLFKLMFLSGVVKLTSHDPLWRNLTALARHYETQPLPNPIAWYFHQMPMWFHKTSCVMMFAIELAVPFLLFAPRRLRTIAGLAIASLQIFILLTGNYTFFNWLTLLLCVVAVDDFTWAAVVPRKLRDAFSNRIGFPPMLRWKHFPTLLFALFFTFVSAIQIVGHLTELPSWTFAAQRWIYPFRSINSYGLFAVMTPDRPEIIVEGSADGLTWKPYSFRHKPGALDRRPTFVAPHQPRLDWQMWFAALGNIRQNPWFGNFCVRLLQGSPDVLALLDENPFPNAPPKYIRARLYDYKFTTREERRATGHWWKRELKGEYLPPFSLEMLTR